MSFTITVGFDETERRYFTLSSDLPGLNIEADTFDEFMQSATEVAANLLDKTEGATLKFEREVALA